MKKLILFIFLVSAIFMGCASNESDTEEERFTLSAEEQENYKSIIDETLKSFYWYYDESSFSYFESAVPSENENTAHIFNAVKETDFDLSGQRGRSAVVYTVNLNHFNGNNAGTAYFYFIRGSLAGMYYSSEDNPASAYGLKTRNVFARNTVFINYETDAPETEYRETYSYTKPEGFLAEGMDSNGNKAYINISDGNLRVYNFRNNRFNLLRTVNFSYSTGMQAISAAFYDDSRVAVILGTPVESESEGGISRMVSEKLVFLDRSYNITNEEIVLTKNSYSCVAAFENRLILINDTTGEVYENKDGAWKSETSFNLNVHATAFKETDLDGDGSKEYILTDNRDLFIFKADGLNLNCIWRTNISVESFFGYIYTGDTNADGAEEIYIADNTGTAIRYTLSPNGLVSKNEDIIYGDMFYVSDFNNDGKADYIKSVGIEDAERTLFISQ